MTDREVAESVWRQWQRMGNLDAFRFVIEALPFDDLERYIGMPVSRIEGPRGSAGDYPEKHDISLARRALGEDWAFVEMMLDTQDGQFYRKDSFDVDYP